MINHSVAISIWRYKKLWSIGNLVQSSQISDSENPITANMPSSAINAKMQIALIENGFELEVLLYGFF